MTGSSARTETRNARLLLIGGGAYLVAMQFGNPQLVLPWIASSLGTAPVLIALIAPAVQVGQVIGQLLIGPRVARLPRRKTAVILADLGLALVIALAGAAAAVLTPQIAGLAIVASAAGFGLCWGLYLIAHQDLMAKTIGSKTRGALISRRVALGGFLTLAGTAAVHVAFPEAATNQALLLWMAVALWILAAAIYTMILEEPQTPGRKQSMLAEIRRGLSLIREHRWFADFLVGRTLFLSVELAIPFYTIYVTTHQDSSGRNLLVFVFAVSLGLVLGGPVWGRMLHRDCHLVMALGAGLLVLGGGALLVVDELVRLQVPYFHAAMFTLLSLGQQGVRQGRTYYLSRRAPADDRPIYISIADALMGALGIIFALFLGWAAQLTSIFNPLLGLIALNMTAAVYALEVLRERPDDGDLRQRAAE